MPDERTTPAAPAKRGLLPSLFAAAIKSHQKLPVRSEYHEHYLDLFVDHHQLTRLDTMDWQVVYGRRGSGKTLLLGVLTDSTNNAMHERRSLAIRVNMPDCIVSPVGVVATDDERALGYFHEFLSRAVREIVHRVDGALGQSTFLDRLTGQRRHRIDTIEGIALELLQLAEDGGPSPAFGQSRAHETRQIEEDEATGFGASIGLDVGTQKRDAGISGKFERERHRHARVVQQVERERHPTLKLAAVRDRIVDLLDAMEIERLTIVIDEWHTLDPSGGTSIQPRFAELLRRTFFGAKQISIKIATNRYQTSFSNRAESTRHCGLELGADLFEATNLDYAILDEAELSHFYARLVFKRLCFVAPELEQFRVPDTDVPHDAFLLSIFKDLRAFNEMVRGALGVPRDFLVLFNEVAQRAGYRVTPLWDAPLVSETIRELAVGGKIHNALTFQSEADQLLNKAIRATCLRSGSRFFLISRESRERFSTALDELLEKRFLHDVPRERMPAALCSDYAGFILDYGTWLEWRRGSLRPPPLLLANEDTLSGFLGSVDALRVDVSVVDRSNLLRCPSCNQWFARDMRLYVKRGICPHCCEDVPADAPRE